MKGHGVYIYFQRIQGGEKCLDRDRKAPNRARREEGCRQIADKGLSGGYIGILSTYSEIFSLSFKLLPNKKERKGRRGKRE